MEDQEEVLAQSVRASHHTLVEATTIESSKPASKAASAGSQAKSLKNVIVMNPGEDGLDEPVATENPTGDEEQTAGTASVSAHASKHESLVDLAVKSSSEHDVLEGVSDSAPEENPKSHNSSKPASQSGSRANLASGKSESSPLADADNVPTESRAVSKPASREGSKPASKAASRSNIASDVPIDHGVSSKPASRHGSKPVSQLGSRSNILESSSAKGSQFNMAQHALADNKAASKAASLSQLTSAQSGAGSKAPSAIGSPKQQLTSPKNALSQGASKQVSDVGSPKQQLASPKNALSQGGSKQLSEIGSPKQLLASPKNALSQGGSKQASELGSPKVKGGSKQASAFATTPNQFASPKNLASPRVANSKGGSKQASYVGSPRNRMDTETAEKKEFDEYFGADTEPLQDSDEHGDAVATDDEYAESHAAAVEAVVNEEEEHAFDEPSEEHKHVVEVKSANQKPGPSSGGKKLKEDVIHELSKDVDYISLISTLRTEIALLKKEIGIRDDKIVGLKDKEHDLMNILDLSKNKGTDALYKNTRICLDRQKKAYQILVAKLRREIRRLKFQRNSTSDPLVEARYFPYLPRTPFSTTSRNPQPGIIGNLPQKASDYFALNPPPPTGNHLDSGNRWWWGSGPDLSSHISARGPSAKSTASQVKKLKPTTPAAPKSPKAKEAKKEELPPISNSNQEEPKVGDRVCVVIDGIRVLGIVKYVGIFDAYPGSGLWCGIKLHLPLGKHDGIVRGKRYFSCEENHGIFVKSDKIISVGHLIAK